MTLSLAARRLLQTAWKSMASRSYASRTAAESSPSARMWSFFENWLYDTVQFIDGIPVISLKRLIEMKQQLGREKDRRDIRLIAVFLAKK